jgi:carbamoyl-phosphate synthase large subunit
VIPPFHKEVIERLPQIREHTHALAKALGVRGLMNVQYAIKDNTVYVLEVNPRASRTVPFVAKATGVALAGLAAKVMTGRTLRELGFTAEPEVRGHFVKESVFPFIKFPGEDPVLGPEMRSTGEVMGVAREFGQAFAKAQLAAGQPLPQEGLAFLSVHDNDKEALVPVARELERLGFRIVATRGTQAFLSARSVACEQVYKVLEGRPNIVDLMKNGDISLIVNTPLGAESYFDEKALRRTATERGIPLVTTLSGAHATVEAIRDIKRRRLEVRSLQEIYAGNGD